jgi:hypothetical protein
MKGYLQLQKAVSYNKEKKKHYITNISEKFKF